MSITELLFKCQSLQAAMTKRWHDNHLLRCHLYIKICFFTIHGRSTSATSIDNFSSDSTQFDNLTSPYVYTEKHGVVPSSSISPTALPQFPEVRFPRTNRPCRTFLNRPSRVVPNPRHPCLTLLNSYSNRTRADRHSIFVASY